MLIRWAVQVDKCDGEPIKHSVLDRSENRWWSSCGQATSSLQCFFCAAVLGDDVSSPAMRQPFQQPAVQPLHCVRQD